MKIFYFDNFWCSQWWKFHQHNKCFIWNYHCSQWWKFCQHDDLTHLPLDNMAAISQTIFSDFHEWKVLYFDQNFTKVSSQWSNWQYPSIALENGLAPNRRQAIIWTNADPIHWRIYAALGGNELKGSSNFHITETSVSVMWEFEESFRFQLQLSSPSLHSTCFVWHWWCWLLSLDTPDPTYPACHYVEHVFKTWFSTKMGVICSFWKTLKVRLLFWKIFMQHT